MKRSLVGGYGRNVIAVVCGLLASAGMPLGAASLDYMYQFTDAFSGAVPASPIRPWIDATFQTLVPGTVRLTVTNITLSGSENVDQLYFNLNTNLQPAKLTFKLINESGRFNTPKISTGINKFQADGDGKYDILFNFNNGGTSNSRFTAGESMTYYITGIPNLTASDFAFLSAPAGGAGPFFAAAHVQRIGPTASLSGWLSATEQTPLTIPEPSAKGLLTLMLGSALALHLSRRTTSCSQKGKLQLTRAPMRRAMTRRARGVQRHDRGP